MLNLDDVFYVLIVPFLTMLASCARWVKTHDKFNLLPFAAEMFFMATFGLFVLFAVHSGWTSVIGISQGNMSGACALGLLSGFLGSKSSGWIISWLLRIPELETKLDRRRSPRGKSQKKEGEAENGV